MLSCRCIKGYGSRCFYLSSLFFFTSSYKNIRPTTPAVDAAACTTKAIIITTKSAVSILFVVLLIVFINLIYLFLVFACISAYCNTHLVEQPTTQQATVELTQTKPRKHILNIHKNTSRWSNIWYITYLIVSAAYKNIIYYLLNYNKPKPTTE